MWGPDGARHLVVATADPAILPDKATWYLVTNLPRPGSPRKADSPQPAAYLAEIVRIYAICKWIEQSHKQVKDELGWADFHVRSDIAIRRHQVLVNCAFSFCWAAWFADHPPHDSVARGPDPAAERGSDAAALPPPSSWPQALRATRAWLSPWIALQRWWPSWWDAPPPRQLQALIDSVAQVAGLHLYILKDLQLWRLRECEVELGLVEEAVDEAGRTASCLRRCDGPQHRRQQTAQAVG